MPTFKMLVGLPASGKSTYARTLEKKGYVVFSSDKLREETGEEDNYVIFSRLHNDIIRTLKEGQDCALDATSLSRRHRRGILDRVKKVSARSECELFIVPPEICIERNNARANKHDVTDEVIWRMVRSFECPWISEGFSKIWIHAYKEGYALPYSREDLLSAEQDTPYHTLTIGAHEQKAYNHLQEIPDGKRKEGHSLLLEAAKYHDDGKLFTKTFINRRGEETETAHYYNHEKVSAYLYLLRAFCTEQYAVEPEMTVSDKIYVGTLISWHMRPMVVWKLSEKAREKDRKIIGERMYQDLCLLSEADAAGK